MLSQLKILLSQLELLPSQRSDQSAFRSVSVRPNRRNAQSAFAYVLSQLQSATAVALSTLTSDHIRQGRNITRDLIIDQIEPPRQDKPRERVPQSKKSKKREKRKKPIPGIEPATHRYRLRCFTNELGGFQCLRDD